MAFEADRVVVELIAKVDGFDAPVKQSATSFDASMAKISAAATKAEATVSATANKSAAAIQRESAQVSQYARMLGGQLNDVGALLTNPSKSPFIVPAKQAPATSGAIKLVGGAASIMGGIMGGIALSGAIALVGGLVNLISKGKDTEDQVNDLVQKLKEHAEQTRLSEQADAIWSRTLEGLSDRVRRVNEELGKRLQVQSQVDDLTLRQSQSDQRRLQEELTREQARLADLQARLASAPKGGVGLGQGGQTVGVDTAAIANQIEQSKERIEGLQRDLGNAVSGVTQGLIIQGERQGKAMADLSEKARLWAEMQSGILRDLQRDNPTLTLSASQLSAAFETLKKAMSDAAGQGVGIDAAIHKSDELNQQLHLGRTSVANYTTEIRKLAKALEDQAEAAKNAKKETEASAIAAFKRNVIGAEGTGKNPMSSAQGFGGFIAGTWLKEFDKIFPQFRNLSESAKLALRDNKQVADAIIDSYARENAAFLKGFGATVTTANLYLAHVLGAAGAKRVLQAAPNTPVSQVIDRRALAANSFLQKAGTAGGVRTEIARRIGDSSPEQGQALASIDAANEALARQAEAELQRRQAFENELANLQGKELDARQALVTSAQAIEELERLAIQVVRDKYDNNLANLVETGKLHQEEADELKKINDETAKLRLDLVDRRARQRQFAEQEAIFRRASEFQQGVGSAEEDLLHSREQLAQSSRERHELERRLIDLQFQEERLRNQYIIDWAARVQANKDASEAEKADAALAAELAKSRQATADERQSNAQTGNDRSNASPLHAYFDDIQGQAGDLNEAFENIAAGGLATFTDALTNAIVNFRSLGDVGRAVLQTVVAGLVRLAIQQVIMATIGKAVQAASTAASAAQGAAVAAAWAPAAAAASLASFGANAGPAMGALGATYAMSAALATGGGIGGLGFASGGRIVGPGSSTSDSIPINASNDEFMVKATSARRIGYDTLEHINRTGTLPGGEMPAFADGGRITNNYADGGRIMADRAIMPSNDTARAPSWAGGGIGEDALRRIEQAVERGAAAQTPVAVYPTMSPRAVVSSILGDPAAQRELVNFFGNNSTRIGGALGR